MTNNQTAAIELNVPAHQADKIRKEYLVMAAHAGRRDRTGSKVHMTRITYWASGNRTISGVNCSANGQLRGTLVQGWDFSAVTCKRCGCGAEAAALRNGKAVIIDVATGEAVGDVMPKAADLVHAVVAGMSGDTAKADQARAAFIAVDEDQEAVVMRAASLADPDTQAALALTDDEVNDLVAAAER